MIFEWCVRHYAVLRMTAVILSVMPCVFGIAGLKLYLYTLCAFFCGLWSARFISQIIPVNQMEVPAFIAMAFICLLFLACVFRLLRKWLVTRKMKLNWLALGISSAVFPLTCAYFFSSKFYFPVLIFAFMFLISVLCEHLHRKYKKEFYTYEDLYNLPSLEET